MKHTFPSKLHRFPALILALVLMICLVGCSGNDELTEEIVTGTVSADNLNVRRKHDPDSKILGQLSIGLEVEILEQTTVDGTDWGRIDEMKLPDGTKIKAGWINLNYVTFPDDTEPTNPPTEPPTDPKPETPVVPATMGMITTGKLNIRSDAGSKYDAVGSYIKGERIEILETKTVDDTLWGRTNKGWIGMGYVKMDGSPESSKSNSNVINDGKTEILGYGVIDQRSLYVRLGPGTSYDIVREVSEGDRYAYYQTMDGWARIEDGWVSISYFYIEGVTADDALTGTVTENGLNIRTGPGTNFKSNGTSNQGDTVQILGQADGWGYTSKGWISMQYVQVTYSTGIGTITTGLNIRKEPNADAESVGTYQEGNIVTITEVNGSWGKTDKGWINLKYVDFD